MRLASILLPKIIAAARSNAKVYSTGSAGLFNKAQLQCPADWVTYAQDTIARCQLIVEETVTVPASASTIQSLDDISDHLCQVYDAAEFCRNAHSNTEWRQQALQAVMVTAKYIQKLNMHQGLYSAVVRSLQHHDRLQSHSSATASSQDSLNRPQGSVAEDQEYNAETVIVGRALQKDFEQRGVHLDSHGQQQALQMSEDLATMGMAITQNASDSSRMGAVQVLNGVWVEELSPSWRNHMNTQLSLLGSKSQFRMHGNGGTGHLMPPQLVPLDQSSVNGIVQSINDEGVRQQVWLASRQTPAENKQAIVDFCILRRDFAQLLGFQSHAHLQAGLASLAGTPNAVVSFLDQAHVASRDRAAEEYDVLRQRKERLMGSSSRPPQQWDRAYLMGAIKAHRTIDSSVSMYLSLHDCLRGLGAVLKQLTGILLEEVPMLPGESWAPGVQKMLAVHETDGELGVIYLDLFPRQGKFGQAAHFTLRCGRKLKNGEYQTPVIALACNFEQSHALLTHHNAATLVHEFGHALHSLLSRTQYQHLSGTRGAMDVIEVPSHFMENYVNDARTLPLFMPDSSKASTARKAEAMAKQVKQDRHMFGALDLETQVCHSLMDQMFHSPEPPQSQAAAADALHEIWSKYSSFPSQRDHSPHLRFAHLVNYGGSYYSYAYAMCLASCVWEKLFQDDPLSRHAGNALRHKLLRPGGAKDPKDLITGVLGHESLQQAGGGYMPQSDGLLHHYGIPTAA
ncbi:hypothetical protein WJX77_002438 [Trebouxia sp. C0004]